MTTIRMVIARPIPSANERDKWHWRKRYQETKAWEIMLRCAVPRPPVRPTYKVHVTILSRRTALIHDDANLRAGAKGLVDALVRVGFLKDDSDTWTHIDYHQVQAPKPFRGTAITLKGPA